MAKKVTAKENVQLSINSANIDACYGAWDSIDDFEAFITDQMGWELTDIAEATLIAVQDPTTKKITKYIRENGAWREDSSGKEYQAGEYGIREIDNTADEPEINVNFGDDQNAIIDTIFGGVTSESGETASEEVLDPSLIISGDNWTPTGVYEYYPSGSSHDEAYAIGRIQVYVSQFNGKLAIGAHISTGTSTSVWEVGETLATIYATTDNSTKETAQLIAVSASQFFAVLEGDALSNAVIAISSATTSKAYGWLWINNNSKYGVQNNISFLEVN